MPYTPMSGEELRNYVARFNEGTAQKNKYVLTINCSGGTASAWFLDREQAGRVCASAFLTDAEHIRLTFFPTVHKEVNLFILNQGTIETVDGCVKVCIDEKREKRESRSRTRGAILRS